MAVTPKRVQRAIAGGPRPDLARQRVPVRRALLPWLLLLGVGRSQSAPIWAVGAGHTCGGKCNMGHTGNSLHYFSMTDYSLAECTTKCLSIGCACFDFSDDARVRPGERCRICPRGIESTPLIVSNWGYASHLCSGSDCHSGSGALVALLVLLGAVGLYVGGGAAYGKRARYRPAAGVSGPLATHPHAGRWLALAAMVRDGTAMARGGRRDATSARVAKAGAAKPLLGDGGGGKGGKNGGTKQKEGKKSGKGKKSSSKGSSRGSPRSASSGGGGAGGKQSPQQTQKEGEHGIGWSGTGAALAERRDEQVHSSQQKIQVVVES
jgi:hypothetical protein